MGLIAVPHNEAGPVVFLGDNGPREEEGQIPPPRPTPMDGEGFADAVEDALTDETASLDSIPLLRKGFKEAWSEDRAAWEAGSKKARHNRKQHPFLFHMMALGKAQFPMCKDSPAQRIVVAKWAHREMDKLHVRKAHQVALIGKIVTLIVCPDPFEVAANRAERNSTTIQRLKRDKSPWNLWGLLFP